MLVLSVGPRSLRLSIAEPFRCVVHPLVHQECMESFTRLGSRTWSVCGSVLTSSCALTPSMLLKSSFLMSRLPVGLLLCLALEPSGGTDAIPFSYQHLSPRCLSPIFHTHSHGASYGLVFLNHVSGTYL